MSKSRARLDRLRRQLLGGFASEAELDAAIEAELAKLDPEEAERFVEEFINDWEREATGP